MEESTHSLGKTGNGLSTVPPYDYDNTTRTVTVISIVISAIIILVILSLTCVLIKSHYEKRRRNKYGPRGQQRREQHRNLNNLHPDVTAPSAESVLSMPSSPRRLSPCQVAVDISPQRFSAQHRSPVTTRIRNNDIDLQLTFNPQGSPEGPYMTVAMPKRTGTRWDFFGRLRRSLKRNAKPTSLNVPMERQPTKTANQFRHLDLISQRGSANVENEYVSSPIKIPPSAPPALPGYHGRY